MFLFQDSDGGARTGRAGAKVEFKGDACVGEGFLEVVILSRTRSEGRLCELLFVCGQEHKVLGGEEMFEQGDDGHIAVMKEMMERMKDPEVMKEWMESKVKEFDALPEDG